MGAPGLAERDGMTHRLFDDFKDPLSPEIRLELKEATDAALHLLPVHGVKDRVTVIRGYLSLIARYPQNTTFLEDLRQAISELILVADEHQNTEVAARFRSILTSV
jgi:hypothetical protein